MKKLILAALSSLLFVFVASAQDQEHMQMPMPMDAAAFQEHLREFVANNSQHGPVEPQPTAVIIGQSTKVFTIVARQFNFTVNPSNFTVNQGDLVQITLSVPSGDGAPVGHGILMDTYIDPGIDVNKGQSTLIQFTATTAGTFQFVCNVPDCGTGHSTMTGSMRVTPTSNPAPTISSIFPTSGSAAGGTSVTISGANFQSGATVKFGTLAGTSVSVTSSTNINVTTPAQAAGKVDVTVTNPDAQSATLMQSYTYVASPPTIASIAPTSGPIAGGTAVTITGTNFRSGATVKFGTLAGTSVNVVSATSITATTPAEAAGKVDVIVTNSDASTATLAQAFTYLAAGVSITSVLPATGTTAGGTVITVTGNGFQNGAAVTVGGLAAHYVTFVDAQHITAATPLGPATEQVVIPRDVVVTNPDSTKATATGAFTYTVPALSVTSILADGSTPSGGVVVTIVGTGFTTALASSVTFGGTAATNVQVLDATSLHATVPAHAAGTVDVVVTIGANSVTVANGFTYGNSTARRRSVKH